MPPRRRSSPRKSGKEQSKLAARTAAKHAQAVSNQAQVVSNAQQSRPAAGDQGGVQGGLVAKTGESATSVEPRSIGNISFEHQLTPFAQGVANLFKKKKKKDK